MGALGQRSGITGIREWRAQDQVSGNPCLVALHKCSVNRKSTLIWGTSVRGFEGPEIREWGAEEARPGVKDLPSQTTTSFC